MYNKTKQNKALWRLSSFLSFAKLKKKKCGGGHYDVQINLDIKYILFISNLCFKQYQNLVILRICNLVGAEEWVISC